MPKQCVNAIPDTTSIQTRHESLEAESLHQILHLAKDFKYSFRQYLDTFTLFIITTNRLKLLQ